MPYSLAHTPLVTRLSRERRAACACAGRTGQGFSIIELVMVTAIIGVLAAVAAPRYTNTLHRYYAEAAARSIAAEFTRARAEARQRSEAQRVQFNLTEHRLTLPDQPDATTGDPRVIRLQSRTYQARLILLDLDDDTDTVQFDGHGMPSTGGRIIVQSGGSQRIVTLHPASGEANIESP